MATTESLIVKWQYKVGGVNNAPSTQSSSSGKVLQILIDGSMF